MGIFIPHDHLPKLKEYKYQSEDRSLTTKYILKPFWSKFVNIFPLWVAPNVVTLSGFGFILINLITVFYYDPYLVSDQPRWTYFSYALGLFLYQTFDACDGLHARRTGQSGPLGELFDHCIDALNTTLSVIVFSSVIGFGYSWIFTVAQFATLTNFYLSTWEEYHTHKLFLSEFSGPVEGVLGIIALFILTGITGPGIWKTHLFVVDLSFLSFSPEFYVTPTTLFCIFGSVGLYFNIECARRNVDKYYKNFDQSLEAYKGLFLFFMYYFTVFAWLWYNPIIIEKYLLPFILTVGLTIAFNVGRIIISHLTKQEFPTLILSNYIPTIQFFIYYLLTLLGYSKDLITCDLIWTCFGLSLGFYIMFVAEIIYEITTYLDIHALSIKHPKTE